MGYDNLIKQSGLDKTTKEAARRIRKINKPRQKEEPDRSARKTPYLAKKEPDKNTGATPVSVKKEQGAAATEAPKEQDSAAAVTPFPGGCSVLPRLSPGTARNRGHFSRIHEKSVLCAPFRQRHHI
jgi:hypothetical protein